ncbi:MAG: pilus assembly protein PilP [Deltaproteobacteria bacterium]|jgi:Tfp pilus assembly protein PilP|nr:pilus assembly protein PilP [Deltaproteobacteria bacterium]
MTLAGPETALNNKVLPNMVCGMFLSHCRINPSLAFTGRLWVLVLIFLLGLAFKAQAQTPVPSQVQNQAAQTPGSNPAPNGLNFSVEVTTPGGAQSPVPLPPPQAPPTPSGFGGTSPAIDPAAAASPVPPTPPMLGRPDDPAQPPPQESEKPLTPAEIEANKAKEELLGELQSWHDSVINTYSFRAGSMSDPFMPIETVARPRIETPSSAQEVKPMIQQLALNQFTLTAIIVGNSPESSMALVDSGGKGYIVYKGTLIGNNNGFVKEITPTKVIIEEPENSLRSRGGSRITEFRLNTGLDSDGEISLSE